MKKLSILSSFALMLLLITGCATSGFYSDQSLEKESGLKFYTVKPYLLVELRSEKDNTIKTSVIYLPDLNKPQYLKMKPGLGSSELKLAFTNGILNSYGSVSESQIPETLESLAALLYKGADAVTQFTGPLSDINEQVSAEVFRLYEIVMDDKGTRLKEVNAAQ